MQPRMALSGISLSLLLSLIGCGQKSAPLASAPPASAPMVQHAIFEPEDKQFTSTEVRQREVAALIEEATKTASEQDKAAFALAAADRSMADLAKMIKAVDTASDIVMNNIRNLDTTAFKSLKARVNGNDVRITTNFEQGSFENTGRPLDIGIQGEGFFRIKTGKSIGNGEGFTRNGNFFVNNRGQIVLGIGDGYALVPPIFVPANTQDISVSSDGTVEVIHAGASNKTVVGHLKLVRFVNPDGLTLTAGSIYTQTVDSGPPIESTPGDDGIGQLVQGFLEGSNVDFVRERMRMRFLLDWRAVLLKMAAK